jgi:hypothetical protein
MGQLWRFYKLREQALLDRDNARKRPEYVGKLLKDSTKHLGYALVGADGSNSRQMSKSCQKYPQGFWWASTPLGFWLIVREVVSSGVFLCLDLVRPARYKTVIKIID